MESKLLFKLLFCNRQGLLRFASSNINFTLISSEDCSLCHNFKKQLDSWNSKNGQIVNYEIVPLRLTKEIFEKYKYDQPVLLHNDTVVLKHYFKSDKLKEYLDRENS
uniref:Glutaredoxin-like protein n=1 Tax=Strongyloides stercoralis TaxID=6248 RepID=A0A0K0EEV4_STRER